MAHIFKHPGLGDIAGFPPPDDTHLIEKYLLQVIDDLHKDPWAYRRFYKCPCRRLKIIRQHCCRADGRYTTVPRINLMGVWLSDAGFEMEQFVCVFPLKNALVICLDEDYLRNSIRE